MLWEPHDIVTVNRERTTTMKIEYSSARIRPFVSFVNFESYESVILLGVGRGLVNRAILQPLDT